MKNKIIRVDQLIDYLKRDINNTELINMDSKKEMERVAQFILSLDTPRLKNNWLDRFEIKTDNNQNNDLLKEKLLNYRKEQF